MRRGSLVAVAALTLGATAAWPDVATAAKKPDANAYTACTAVGYLRGLSVRGVPLEPSSLDRAVDALQRSRTNGAKRVARKLAKMPDRGLSAAAAWCRTVGAPITVAPTSWALPPSTARPASSPPNTSAITRAEYEAIQPGMTYDEVVEIIGGPGEEISSSSLGGFTTVMYSWRGSGSLGANANAMFQNGRLISKAQFGL